MAAVRFAGSCEELAGPLLALVWELAVRPGAAQRACAAALAGALVPCLPLQQARARPPFFFPLLFIFIFLFFLIR